MALTYSSMLELGTELIPFELPDTINDGVFSDKDLDSARPTLIMFICNHCPYVIHYHEEIKKLACDFLDQINIVAISSNDIENYPQDRPKKMKELWRELNLSFPYLYDETQDVAKQYQAECTPEFYLFNLHKRLVYRGRMDESSPGTNIIPSAIELRNAINAILRKNEISSEQYPSMGCNIKWKK